MNSLSLPQKLALQQALLHCFDLRQIKQFFYELDLQVDPLETKSRAALAYDLAHFTTRPEPLNQLAELLRLARALDPHFEWSPQSEPVAATVFMVPPRNDYFTARAARAAQLEALAAGLAQQQVMAVCGLGGMGKTQTLVEFAHRQRSGYSAVLWFGAESAEALDGSWLAAAQALGFSVVEANIEVARAQVMLWLQTEAGWLLVLDNVESLPLVRDWVGVLKAFGHVVLSTREMDTRPVAEPVVLDRLTAEESLAFLTRRTGLVADAAAAALVEALDGLPLALEQAAAYVAGKSFARYWALYQKHGVRLLEKRGALAHSSDHPDPVAVTWLLSFEAVSSVPLAQSILQQCAFLYGDGIVQSVFAELDELEYDEALDTLSQYSLLQRDEAAEMLRIHRLVQMVVRSLLSVEEQQEIVAQVVGLLVIACPRDETDFFTWSNRSADWLLNGWEIKEWSLKFKRYSENLGKLLNHMGYYLYKTGDYSQASKLFQEALYTYEKVTQKQNPNYVETLNNLAILYYIEDNYTQSLLLFQNILQIREQTLGKQHPDYAETINNLATLYRVQGDNRQALVWFQEALQIREQTLGNQHPDYAISLNNLAELYKIQGDYAQALSLYQEALQIRQQILGKWHPDYARSLNNLAELYDLQGDYLQALTLYQEALQIRERVLGKLHPDYAQSLNNIARLYEDQGNYAQALSLYQKASEIWGEVLGKRHPHYAQSLNNLATLYNSQGDYAQALPLFQEALQVREHMLGKLHPDYAQSLNNLATLYNSQGDYAQALPLHQEALQVREQVLGKLHPLYATSLNNLAELYRTQGDYAQALPLYQEALTIFTQALGEQHPNTQTVKANYERCQQHNTN